MKDVYVLLCDKKVKIGSSIDVYSRVKNMLRFFSNVEIIRIYEQAGSVFERELQKMFDEYHIPDIYYKKEFFSVDIIPHLPKTEDVQPRIQSVDLNHIDDPLLINIIKDKPFHALKYKQLEDMIILWLIQKQKDTMTGYFIHNITGLPMTNIYRTLNKLHQNGYVDIKNDTVDGRSRKYYNITENGNIHLYTICVEWETKIELIETIISRTTEPKTVQPPC